MITEEAKKIISKNTGVPLNLLCGESEEDNIKIAEELLAYKRSRTPNNNREEFSLIFKQWEESELKTSLPLQTKNNESSSNKGRIREQFEEWLNDQLSYDLY